MSISTITADSYGFVTTTFAGHGFTGKTQVGPDGLDRGDGDGAWLLLDTMQGFLPSQTVPPCGVARRTPLARVGPAGPEPSTKGRVSASEPQTGQSVFVWYSTIWDIRRRAQICPP